MSKKPRLDILPIRNSIIEDMAVTIITDLPPEMIREIGKYLPLEDLKNLRLARRQFSGAIEKSDIIRRVEAIRTVESYQIAMNLRDWQRVWLAALPEYAAQLMRVYNYAARYGESLVVGDAFSNIERNVRLELRRTGHPDMRWYRYL